MVTTKVLAPKRSLLLLKVKSLLLLALLISAPSYALTKVTAHIDKNPVMVNESFILTVTADDRVSSNAFDSSALLGDFIVGNTSTSSQQSIVNGKSSRSTSWKTLLIARQAGKKVIPPLSINNLSTQPITVEVVAASDQANTASKDIFISTEISSSDIYVQQLLTLTVKLHFSVQLERGSLSEPSLENANINQVGKDQESDQIINGKRYRVIERTYSLSPQQSGQFTIKGPVFNGEVMVQSPRRNSFMNFAESKPISILGDDIDITVKAIPLDYQGNWLPSELVALHQEWQPEPSTFTVGEPITRVLTLTAAGLSEEQLPELTMPTPAGLKVYPDQAELHSGINQERLVSQKVQKFALVASKPGKFELPEIRIPWWNTVTNKKELAIIPAQTVVVSPNPDAQPVASQTNNNNQEALPTISPAVASQAQDNEQVTGAELLQSKLVWALGLLTVLLSAACLWLWRQNQQLRTLLKAFEASANLAKQQTRFGKQAGISRQELLHQGISGQQYSANNIIQACKDNAGEQVLTLLPQWANLHIQPESGKTKAIESLDEVLNLIADHDFSQCINELQSCYFSKQQSAWQGKQLARVLARLEKQLKKSQGKLASRAGLSLNP